MKKLLSIAMLCLCATLPSFSCQVYRSPLHNAVKFNDIKKCKELLANYDTDVNTLDNNGFTPLAYAIINKQIAMVDQELRDLQKQPWWGKTDLPAAIVDHSTFIIIALLMHPDTKLSMKNRYFKTPFHLISFGEDLQIRLDEQTRQVLDTAARFTAQSLPCWRTMVTGLHQRCGNNSPIKKYLSAEIICAIAGFSRAMHIANQFGMLLMEN